MASSTQVREGSVLAISITYAESAESSQSDDSIATTQSAQKDTSLSRSFDCLDVENNEEVMIKEPETRPISQEQLVAEVKGIYAGLVMVESKCIEVDNAQSSTRDTGPTLNNEQWQALIALHRTLLHEHHDFFLASQHPSASPALRRLASKYAMPARMWRHGIHSFLELLRHRLPASLEHMLTFIYLAYSMMALLYETVPTFKDTWIECLGDLGRYRMAIEDDSDEDREVWTSVSRHWYSKASAKAPTTGRLYHHLDILARPNALQQLFYYTKSLCVPIPFLSARESIMTLFDPHLNGTPTRLEAIDAAFLRAHGVLFSGKSSDLFDTSVSEFIDNLDKHIARNAKGWMDCGYFIAIALGCAMLEYGSESNSVMMAIKTSCTDDVDVQMGEPETSVTSQRFLDALDFAARTHDIVFRRFADSNVNPYLHVTLSFLYHMSHFPTAMGYIETRMPWKHISFMLSALLRGCASVDRINLEDFPRPNNGTPRPLPEDFAQRGLLWVDGYYPHDWFASKLDDDEKYFEVASMTEEREERCLWLGCRLASWGNWLIYDKFARRFRVPPQYNIATPDLDEGWYEFIHDKRSIKRPCRISRRIDREGDFAHEGIARYRSEDRENETKRKDEAKNLIHAGRRRQPTGRAVARLKVLPHRVNWPVRLLAMSPQVVRDPDEYLYGILQDSLVQKSETSSLGWNIDITTHLPTIASARQHLPTIASDQPLF
ncbi:hypothetical protein CSUB01_11167, partial [Colletotrichum sublineola]